MKYLCVFTFDVVAMRAHGRKDDHDGQTTATWRATLNDVASDNVSGLFSWTQPNSQSKVEPAAKKLNSLVNRRLCPNLRHSPLGQCLEGAQSKSKFAFKKLVKIQMFHFSHDGDWWQHCLQNRKVLPGTGDLGIARQHGNQVNPDGDILTQNTNQKRVPSINRSRLKSISEMKYMLEETLVSRNTNNGLAKIVSFTLITNRVMRTWFRRNWAKRWGRRLALCLLVNTIQFSTRQLHETNRNVWKSSIEPK